MRRKLLFVAIVWLTLSVAVAQDEIVTCETILEQTIDFIGYNDQQELTLPLGTTVEYIGQQPDGSAWILRQAGQYMLYPTSSPDLRPIGCEPSSWGPPPREYLPLQMVMDEVGITNWHDQGYFGQGVRVGILDTRYDDLSATIEALPISESQVTFKPSLGDLETLLPQAERTEAHHGTNVLEVMAYIAPQAEYVLARSVDAASFSQAVDDLIAENVQIIVHASNVITSDPTPYHDAVRRADAAGILWINSAGNMGTGYYPARYSGDDIVTVHQFSDPNRAGTQASLMVPVNPNGNAQVTLVWDEAGDAVPNDFELVVYGSCNRRDQTSFEPKRSDANQASGAPTYESVPLSNGVLQQINDYTMIPSVGARQDCPDVAMTDGIADNEIYITVLDAVGNAQIDSRFDLYIDGALPAEFDPDIKVSLDPVVLVPGDIAESFTIGAYNWQEDNIAWYSGRLNSLQYYELNNFDVDYSNDELMKPNIVTYGELLLPSRQQFFGTSASTPIVGGAIALFRSANQSMPISEIRDQFTSIQGRCLSDGILGRPIRTLDFEISVNYSDTLCEVVPWRVDTSSVLVENFVLPELIAASTVAERQASLVRSLDLSERSQVAMSNSDSELALALALEANNMADPPLESIQTLANIAYAPMSVISRLEIPDSVSSNIAFSSDSQYVAVGTLNGSVYVIATHSGEIVREIEPFEGGVWNIAFNPSLPLLAFTVGNTIQIYDLDTTTEVSKITTSYVEDIRFTTDGFKLISQTNEFIDIWDWETGVNILRIKPRFQSQFDTSRDNNYLITVGNDDDSQGVEIWDLINGDMQGYIEIEGEIDQNLTALFLGMSQRIVISGENTPLQIVDLTTEMRTVLSETPVDLYVPSQRSNSIWYLDGNRQLIEFNVLAGTVVSATQISDNILFLDSVISPNGFYFVADEIGSLSTSSIVVRQISPGPIISTLITPVDIGVIRTIPERNSIIYSRDNGNIIVRDLQSGNLIHEFSGHTAAITDLEIVVEDNILISSSSDTTARGWDLSSGSLLYNIELPNSISDVAVDLSRNYLLLASGGMSWRDSNAVFVHDLSTGERIDALVSFGDGLVLTAAAISVDINAQGTLAITGGGFPNSQGPAGVIIWQPDELTVEQVFEGYLFGEFSPTQQNLLAVWGAGNDNIILWNTETQETYLNLNFPQSISGISFSSHDEYLIANNTYLLDYQTGQQIREYAYPVVAFGNERDSAYMLVSPSKLALIELHPTLDDLLDWVHNNRHIRALTCEEIINYGISEICEISENTSDAPISSLTTMTPAIELTPAEAPSTSVPLALTENADGEFEVSILNPTSTPTNSPQLEGYIDLNDYVEGSISRDVDVVWKFVANQGQMVSIEVNDVSSGITAIFEVIDPDGNIIGRATPPLSNGTLTWIYDLFLPQSGDYTIKISHISGNLSGRYSLTIEDISPDFIEIVQYGDTYYDGIDIDESHSFNLYAEAGQVVAVTLSPYRSQLDPQLFVFSENGTRLFLQNTSSSQKLVEITETGIYTIIVRAHIVPAIGVASTSGEYELIVELDSVQPTPTPSTATAPIAIGATVEDRLANRTIHTYEFEGTEGQTIVIDMIRNFGIDPYIELYSENGDLLEANDDYVNLNARIGPLSLPYTGYYTLLVSSSNDDEGSYSLQLRAVDTEYASSSRFERPIEASSWESDYIAQNAQHTWLYDGFEGDIIFVEMIATNTSALDTQIEVYNPSNISIGFNDDYSNTTNSRLGPINLDESGVYRIIASGHSPSTSGDYRLLLTKVEPLDSNLTSTQNIFYDERQAFSFFAENGQIARVQVVDHIVAPSNEPAAYMYLPSGSEIGSNGFLVFPETGIYTIFLIGNYVNNNESVLFDINVSFANELTPYQIDQLDPRRPDLWRVNASIGDKLFINRNVLTPDAFANLQLYYFDGEEIMNTDILSGSRSIEYEVPSDGTYIITVNGSLSSITDYEITLEIVPYESKTDESGEDMLSIGQMVLVRNLDVSEVWIRESPSADELNWTVIPSGSIGRISGDPVNDSIGQIWYPIEIVPSGVQGWIESPLIFDPDTGLTDAYEDFCSDAGGFHFRIGQRFIVAFGDGSTSVYSEPNSQPRVGMIEEGETGMILDGSVCDEGQRGNLLSWYVRSRTGIEGWVSEGYPDDIFPWIIPIPDEN